ncbi:MAG: carbohydrate ABC transporter substrate-binding protein [Thermoproteota archaeon]|nr:MAG: carbohydrate ABC transporter substrate-binding protein [Candidatus Korarchaeota archaeon]RLG54952.1 MAG: carbohydrate ABC transporter substrate-binding protein [Candidatus Korarchaeota archaeon]
MRARGVSKVVLAVVIIGIIVVAAVAGYLLFLKPPPKIVWASTQLNPPKERAYVEELLKEFTAETGIEVEFVPMKYEELVDKLEAEQKAGKVTMSLIGDLHGGLDLFASKGYLEDLSKFGALPGRTFPKVLEDYSRIHGIKAYVPWMTATYVMVVNKKAYNYLPPGLTKEDIQTASEKWSYEALLEWAKKVNEATGGKKLGFPIAPKGLWHRFLHGYIYPSYTGAQVKNFNSADALEMWDYLKRLWPEVNPASTTWDAMAEPLLKEEVLIAWDHTARIKDAITTKPDQFEVVPVPRGPKGRGFILVVAGLAIPKGAPNQEAAWKLIEFLTRPETQVKILQNVGFFPSTNEAVGAVPAGALKILASGVNRQVGSRDALLAMIPSLGPKGGEFTKTYRDAFDRIVKGGEDPKAVVDELHAKLMKLFKETGAPLPPPDS